MGVTECCERRDGPRAVATGKGRRCQTRWPGRTSGSWDSARDGGVPRCRPVLPHELARLGAPLLLEVEGPFVRGRSAEVERAGTALDGELQHVPVQEHVGAERVGTRSAEAHGTSTVSSMPAHDRGRHRRVLRAARRRTRGIVQRTAPGLRERSARCRPACRDPACCGRTPRRTRPAGPLRPRPPRGRSSRPCGPGCAPCDPGDPTRPRACLTQGAAASPPCALLAASVTDRAASCAAVRGASIRPAGLPPPLDPAEPPPLHGRRPGRRHS